MISQSSLAVKFTAKSGNPLGLEKSRRIDFSLRKWMFIDPNALKLMSKHVKGPGELVRTFFRSLFRP